MLRNTLKLTNHNSLRSMYLGNVKLSEKSVEPAKQTPEPQVFSSSTGVKHRPNALERKLLVWTKKYKSESEIPPEVPIETIELARNRGRIKIANIMMLMTAVGCFFVALSGRRAAERGESVEQMNIDWHKEMKDKKD